MTFLIVTIISAVPYFMGMMVLAWAMAILHDNKY